MPKLNPRRERALEVMKQLNLGPAFVQDLNSTMPYDPRTAALQYRRWVRAWVLPTICELVPELKGKWIE